MKIPLPPVPLPAHVVDRAREYDDGTRTAAEPRNAATVILLRPSDRGPEVYLMRRQVSMEFAGGMCVYPGGGVDQRDFDAQVGWAGPSAAEWAVKLGTDEETARALVCAAVRETFEESGVLLAGTSATTVVADTTADDWEADRHALESRDLAMTEFLTRRGLVLRTDLLGAWGGWLTPVFEPKRYRTWFFVARLPEGQVTRDVSSESSSVTWLPALDAAAAADSGEIMMMPPTYLTCLEVGQFVAPADVFDAADGRIDRDVHAVRRTLGGGIHPLHARPPATVGDGAPLVSGAGWAGGSFGNIGRCVLAPNANMMTLDGTNTWVLREPDARRSIVVDPGPSILSHLDAIAEAAGEVAIVLLTHHHADHSEAAREFAERMGCGVRALDPAHRLGSEGLGDGDVVAVDGLEVHVVATPGHTADSLSFVLPAERAVLTGDTVLGRGTTVVAHPDGELGAYLGSLDRLHALAEAEQITSIWPGHGPVIENALGALDFYLAHRQERLGQVEAAVAALREAPHPEGIAAQELPRKVVEMVYVDVDPVLWGAAELSVRAQLAYLADRG